MNGHVYELSGINKTWKGLRWKISKTSDHYESLIADYIYFKYEQFRHTKQTSSNEVVLSSKGATPTINLKAISVYNDFVKQAQGIQSRPKYFIKNGLIGVDYKPVNNEVTLHDFINDQNQLADETYPYYNPEVLKPINQFGI